MSNVKLEELRTRPHHEQRSVVISFLRMHLEEEVAENGLPASLSRERWTHMQSQGDMAFLRGVERVRRRHPEFGVPPQQWQRRLRRRASIAARLEALVEPTEKFHARFPKLEEAALRRRFIVERRHRIEQVFGRDLRLRPFVMERLRSLNPHDFAAAVGAAMKLIPEGADLNAGLSRWLDRRTGPKKGHRSGPRSPLK